SFFFSFFVQRLRPPTSTLFPYTTLFRSQSNVLFEHSFRDGISNLVIGKIKIRREIERRRPKYRLKRRKYFGRYDGGDGISCIVKDRKSTRLNSSHVKISYAVFCLKKKNR